MFALRMRDERGGSLVEFAVIAPLLFVILFGIIEFGILLYDKAIITNASREGARAGIVFDTALRNDDKTVNTDAVTNKAIQVVIDYCSDKKTNKSRLISFGSGSQLKIHALVSEANGEALTFTSGDSLTVTVEYPFRFLVFSNIIALLGSGMENLVNLKAETVMRLE